MAINVNPPPTMKIPKQWQNDPEISAYYKNFDRMMLQLWLRTGGANDSISDVEDAQDGALSRVHSRLGDIEKTINDLQVDSTMPINKKQESEHYGTISLDYINKRLTDIEAQL